jgi:hypothetical protein
MRSHNRQTVALIVLKFYDEQMRWDYRFLMFDKWLHDAIVCLKNLYKICIWSVNLCNLVFQVFSPKSFRWNCHPCSPNAYIVHSCEYVVVPSQFG